MHKLLLLIHLITLPTEIDASFKKALPILNKYVPKENLIGVPDPGAEAVAVIFEGIAS